MNYKILRLTLITGVIHFGLVVLSLYNGVIIFRSPTTASEIFWADAIRVLLFPIDVIFKGVYNDWVQAGIFILNSLLWGYLISLLILRLRKKRI
jgi:hypothetical protein